MRRRELAVSNEKEEQLLRNRMTELAEKSFQQNIFTFTGFLGLSEQDIFWKIERKICHAGYLMYGGTEGADRVVIRFGNVEEFGYEIPFPIACVHIKPLVAKFAESLSHRDFLGALMNLGIERTVIGDIKVGEKDAYLFCMESIAEHICSQLDQVRHTHVSCEIVEDYTVVQEEAPENITVQVSSMRVDAVIAKVYHKSRNECLELFRAGKVFVNGRLCENNSKILNQGETVNVRGYGKFNVDGDVRETRKGKLSVSVSVYR